MNEGADTEPETKGAAAKTWGLTHKHHFATPSHTGALEDEHDEYCRICWSGVSQLWPFVPFVAFLKRPTCCLLPTHGTRMLQGDLICCETCPAVFHPACLGLSAVPEEDEWFCPLCRCASCGFCGFQDGVEDMKREQVRSPLQSSTSWSYVYQNDLQLRV